MRIEFIDFSFANRAAKLFIAILEETVSVLKSSEFCFTLEAKECYSSFPYRWKQSVDFCLKALSV